MRTIVLGAAVGCATAAMAADTVKVIYSEIPGDPTNMVPAGADVPAGTGFDAFDRPYRSPDGTRWIIGASTNGATAEDEILILGSGMAGMTVVREGTTFGSPSTGELVGLIDTRLSVSNGGMYAFATNTDGPTTADEYIVLFDGASWVAGAQEGDLVPGFPTEAFGSTLNSANLAMGPVIGFRATTTVGDLPSDQDDFLILGGAVLAQSGVTVPGGAADAWQTFDSEDFFVSADGTQWIAQGDLLGDTTMDDVVVVNGDVVIREGSVLAGSAFTSPVGLINGVFMEAGGTWIARGDNADDQDWVVVDGDVVAVTGESITPGSSETWSDALFSSCFFWMAADDLGNHVVGGTTSNPDDFGDAVLVLNGTTVLARQGDPVDVDGNGVYDDGAVIDIFNNDDGFLTNDGMLYFTAELNDLKGNSLGQAFMVYDISRSSACTGDIAPVPADGAVNFDDLVAVLAAWGACPEPCATGCPGDVNRDCLVGFDDLVAVLANWGPCS